MKSVLTLFVFLISCATTFLIAKDSPLKADFVVGDPGIQSINAMAFGPEGILFIGDSKAAGIAAVDLSAHAKVDNTKVKINDLDGLVAKMLGSSKDGVQITDMVVNPENGNIYLSAHHSSGKAILFRVNGESLEQVSLTSLSHSKTKLVDAIAADAKDRRGRSMGKWAISDIHYADGKLMVSGLSNKEFASTFRSIDFPFGDNQMYGSLEIYHAAHGQYETHSPIKTFTTTELNGTPHLIASYTCTPLVIVPLNAFKAGEHTKARTIAELGNRNTPLDIIEMKKDGERYILMANSSRALMRFKVSDIEDFGDSLTKPVTVNSGTEGIDFISLPLVNVQQLSKLNDKQFVMVQRESNGNLALKTGGGNRWL